MDGVELQRVGPADADTFLALVRAFHDEDGHPLTERGEAAAMMIARGHPQARAWLIVEGGEAIGYAALCLGFGIEYGGPDAFVDDIYLLPAARGRGIGRTVLERLEAEARRLGLKALFLVVDPENRRALDLYERMGFAGTHWLLMAKPL